MHLHIYSLYIILLFVFSFSNASNAAVEYKSFSDKRLRCGRKSTWKSCTARGTQIENQTVCVVVSLRVMEAYFRHRLQKIFEIKIHTFLGNGEFIHHNLTTFDY